MEQPIFLQYFIAETTSNSFLVQTIINALALLVGANFIKGVEIKGFGSAVLIAIILALLNATIGAFFYFIGAPLRWITLGLFAFVIDAVVIMIAANFMKSLQVDGFKSAVFLAIVLSIVNLILCAFV